MKTYDIEGLKHYLAQEVITERSRRSDVRAALRKAQRIARTLLPDVETTDFWIPLAAVLALQPYDYDSAVRLVTQLRRAVEAGMHWAFVDEVDQIVAGLDAFIMALLVVN